MQPPAEEGGAHQHEALYSHWHLKGQGDSDATAHGQANNVCPLNLLEAHEAQGHMDEKIHRIATEGLVGSTESGKFQRPKPEVIIKPFKSPEPILD